MIENLNIEEMGAILDNSFNYDAIRRYAVGTFNRTNKLSGISEKCKIIFNPYKHLLILRDNDSELEKYFDFEKYDEELTDLKAIEYRKAFVFAFQYLYKNNELMK